MPSKFTILKKQIDASTSGSQDVDTTYYRGYVFLLNVSALAGGTTPATTVSLVTVDEYGNEHTIGTTAAINTLNQKAVFTHHVVLQNPIGDKTRIKWATTGAPTTFTLDVSMYGYGLEM